MAAEVPIAWGQMYVDRRLNLRKMARQLLNESRNAGRR
jgi:hypothetical protein